MNHFTSDHNDEPIERKGHPHWQMFEVRSVEVWGETLNVCQWCWENCSGKNLMITKEQALTENVFHMTNQQRSADEQFFYDHAGFSYNPDTETPDQGRERCAIQLALAERIARSAGAFFIWEDDWLVGSHLSEFGDAYDKEPTTCEWCGLYLPEQPHPLISLGCIDDADDDYRRVVQAELAAAAPARISNTGQVWPIRV